MIESNLQAAILAHARRWFEQAKDTEPPARPDPITVDAWQRYTAARTAYDAMQTDAEAGVAPASAAAILGHSPTNREAVAFSRALKSGEAAGLWRVVKTGSTRAVQLVEAEQ
ncbi:hypothetical protein [Algisphaera agarilytica]|uniref:Uncharacterized protein n=1 Tax=Algisphaera agarilytica TaxID=1385975 RepID=A0A7X0LLP6_9BACT|nr:hypothetical protein [Algisphaera agarilytica]MBB6431129.1 hypothetical protein [Algisphaera agarilytica]